jgi:hypothetical protein
MVGEEKIPGCQLNCVPSGKRLKSQRTQLSPISTSRSLGFQMRGMRPVAALQLCFRPTSEELGSEASHLHWKAPQGILALLGHTN